MPNGLWLTGTQDSNSPTSPSNIVQLKGDEYEATRQNEPVEGSPEEKKCQKKPEKIEWGEEASLMGVAHNKT
jgi:hypothetical protein